MEHFIDLSTGSTFYWESWNLFLYGWELKEVHDLLPELNCNVNLN